MQEFEKRENIVLFNEGQKIFGILHRPLHVTKAPCVLFCHGLAGQKTGAHRMYVHLSEELVKAGIASMRFDFRGSGDSEGAFIEMTLKGEVSDALSAIHFLIDDPFIDNERIGLFGRSFGAAIALLAAEKFGHARSLALWAPIFDGHQWEEQWEQAQTDTIDEEERHNLMRIDGQMPSLSFYTELFKMDLGKTLSSLHKIPLLTIHGKSDPIVAYEHTERYKKIRAHTETISKFITLEHSDHDFSHPEEKQHAIIDTCQWFKDTL